MEISDWLELVWLALFQVFGLVFFPGHYLDGFCGRRGLVTVDDLAIPIFRTFSLFLVTIFLADSSSNILVTLYFFFVH